MKYILFVITKIDFLFLCKNSASKYNSDDSQVAITKIRLRAKLRNIQKLSYIRLYIRKCFLHHQE